MTPREWLMEPLADEDFKIAFAEEKVMCCSPEEPRVFYAICYTCRRIEPFVPEVDGGFYRMPDMWCRTCFSTAGISMAPPILPPLIDSLPGTPVDSDFAAKLEPRI